MGQNSKILEWQTPQWPTDRATRTPLKQFIIYMDIYKGTVMIVIVWLGTMGFTITYAINAYHH